MYASDREPRLRLALFTQQKANDRYEQSGGLSSRAREKIRSRGSRSRVREHIVGKRTLTHGCTADGIEQHTEHAEMYVRNAS